MSAAPRAVFAEAFSGFGLTEDGFYAVAEFALPGEDAPLHIAFPKHEMSMVIESAAMVSIDGVDDGQTQTVTSFPLRDVKLNETTNDELLLRVGFGPEAHIRFRLSKAAARLIADRLERAGSSPRKNW